MLATQVTDFFQPYIKNLFSLTSWPNFELESVDEKPLRGDATSNFQFLYFYFNVYLFIYLAVLDLV